MSIAPFTKDFDPRYNTIIPRTRRIHVPKVECN
jgi:hypothetical protein